MLNNQRSSSVWAAFFPTVIIIDFALAALFAVGVDPGFYDGHPGGRRPCGEAIASGAGPWLLVDLAILSLIRPCASSAPP
jgi:hypothetical protein